VERGKKKKWKHVRITSIYDVEIPPKIAVTDFIGYLKGKSSTMLYEQFGELKYKYRNR